MSYIQPMLAAADDDIDLSPQGFMIRLREAEALVQNDDGQERKFIAAPYALKELSRWIAKDISLECGAFAAWSDYFYALASSRKLSDRDKIKRKRVFVPCFTTGTQEQQAIKIAFARTMSLVLPCPIGRLFIAAAYRMNLCNDSLLFEFFRTALYRTDAHLVEKLLKHGVNPNGIDLERDDLDIDSQCSFQICPTVVIAQLLLLYKADIVKQQAKCSIMENLCQRQSEKDDDLLAFYLEHIPLTEDNKFGQKWIEAMIDSSCYFKALGTQAIIYKKCKSLFDKGCSCDKAYIMKKIDNNVYADNQRKLELKEMMQGLFNERFESLMIKGALDSEAEKSSDSNNG